MSSLSKKWIVLMVLVYLLIVSVVMLNNYPVTPLVSQDTALTFAEAAGLNVSADTASDTETDNTINRIEVMFSHPEHFYDNDIEVTIYASVPEAVIYYTTDGSTPTTASRIYRRPILITAADNINDGGVMPLKAIAVYENLTSLPRVHTYFVAKDVNERFDVMIIALSTNDEFLYDYDIGILVEGRTRDEFIAENPRARIDPPAPANFNWRGMESERPVNVEIFEIGGERVISQIAGMRVHGGWSRAANQKSFRLIARNMYEQAPGEGRFSHDFFPENVRADDFGTPIIRYDQLILSNNANDRDFAMLRQEVNYNLARSAGLLTSPVRAAAVFLNGEYYGFTWLQVNQNEQYLEYLYTAPTREFQIIGNGELWIATEDPVEIEAIEQFNDFYYKDFTDDRVLAEFEALVDIDNLMRYYAYQTYVGNRDWPNNNMKRWRYLGEQTDGLSPELDGRWRYITYDLDFTLALYESEVRPNDPAFTETLRHGSERYSYMLDALFVRPDMVDMYAMYVCDIANNILTPENVAEQIELLYSEAYNEIGYAIEAERYARWVSHGSVEDNHRNMIIYAAERREYFIEAMREYFEWEEGMFTVEVTGGDAVIGTQQGTSSTYFTHLDIPLNPVLSRYIHFDHWVLNGEIIDTPEITVSIEDADEDGVVRVELIMYETQPSSIVISEAYGSSERNGAVLKNESSETLTTAGLYFTDDLSNPFYWAMPLAYLEPGGTLEFAGRGSKHESDIHKIQMSFNVRNGRILYLCNEDGEVLDWFVVTPE